MMNMNFKRKLPIPLNIKEEYPISDEIINVKNKNDVEIRDIFVGRSNKFLIIIGPCSADNSEAVMQYAKEIKNIQDIVKDKIKIILRVYTAKPRTVVDGYLGLIHQPNPSGEPDMLNGLITCRKLFIDLIKETGLPLADEMLYPENHRYFSDVLSYVAVGARSVEDQQHRLTASGLSIPVGMKNPISGSMKVLANSIASAQKGQTFLYRGWEVESYGNDLTHAVLRGYVEHDGIMKINYDVEHVKELIADMEAFNIKNKAIIIDTNHANSGKDYRLQSNIAVKVVEQIKNNSDLNYIKGLMIESYLVDGCQMPGEKEFGKSITDGCLGIEKTKKLIENIYKILE